MKPIRNICCVILFLVCLLSLSAQQKKVSSPENNLYQMALSATADEMEKSWGNIDESCCISSIRNSRMRTDYRHLVVEKVDWITEGLPPSLGDHQLEYLDTQGLIDRFHKLRKEFKVLRIHPMRANGSSLNVQISVYWVHSKKKRVFYAYSEWSVVEFHYDCEKQEWVIANVKLGGI